VHREAIRMVQPGDNLFCCFMAGKEQKNSYEKTGDVLLV
jgi:hypothetical protein